MRMIPVIRGQFGSTEYFITTMKAADVVSTLKIPREMPDWENESIEEKYQREISYKRVADQIAPYLATDPDRFFGALIVDILDSDGISFESLRDSNIRLTRALQALENSFGMLYLTGQERLVPLDGQHRLAALNFAMNGRNERGEPLDSFPPNAEIARDDVTLILVKHDRSKARKIFNKVNRYAKPTSKANNLITSDDDFIAVLSREIVNSELTSELVNRESNTLPANSGAFTTLSTVYEASLGYLERSGISGGKIDTTKLPSPDVQQLFRQELTRLWDLLTSRVRLFSDALHDKDKAGDEKRIELRKEYVLLKPVAQLSLTYSLARVVGGRRDLEAAIDLVNKIDWRASNPMWQQILLIGDRVVSGKQAVNFAARFLAYLLGEQLEEKELEQLRTQYVSLFPREAQRGKRLPTPVTQ